MGFLKYAGKKEGDEKKGKKEKKKQCKSMQACKNTLGPSLSTSVRAQGSVWPKFGILEIRHARSL